VCRTVHEDTHIQFAGFPLLWSPRVREHRLRGFVESLIERPQTVAEQVANVLREAIASGTLKAGTALRGGLSRKS